MFKFKKLSALILAIALVFTSFSNITEVHAEDSGIARITVQDTSGVPLSYLDFTVRNSSGASVQFSGSSGIYSYGSGSSTVTCSSGLIRLDNLPVGSYSLSYSGNDPSYTADAITFSISADNTTYETVTARSLAGSLNLTLTGEGSERLSGVNFRIQQNGSYVRFVYDGAGYIENSNGNDTLTTNGNGQIIINKLSSGTYTAVQQNYVSNYNADMVSQSFNISAGNNTNLNVTNSKNYGTLNIYAVDDKGNQVAETINLRLGNSNVGVFNTGNSTFEYSANAGNDQISITGAARITGLPFGEYVVHVANIDDKFTAAADERVYIGSSSPQEVRLVNKAKATQDSDGAVLNEESTSLKILVSSEDGAVDAYPFMILDSDSKEISFRESGTGIYQYATGARTKNLYTSPSGVLVINDLPAGKYFVVDQKLGGYKYQKTKKSVDLSLGKIEEYRFTAIPTKYSLALSSDGVSSLEGIAVKIYDSNNELVLDGLTDANGDIVLDGFEDGDYKAVIEELPNGFINDKYSVDFKVDNNSSDLIAGNIDLQESFIEVRTGEKGETVVLRNTLTNEEIKQISDDRGIVTFKGLKDGEYTVSFADKSDIITIDRNYTADPVDFSSPDSSIKPSGDSNIKPSNDSEGFFAKLFDKLPFPWWWLLLPLFLALLLIALLIAVLIRDKRDKKEAERLALGNTTSNIEDLDAKELSKELGVGLQEDFNEADSLLLNIDSAPNSQEDTIVVPVVDESIKEAIEKPVVEEPKLSARDRFMAIVEQENEDINRSLQDNQTVSEEDLSPIPSIKEESSEIITELPEVEPSEVVKFTSADDLEVESEEEKSFVKKTNSTLTFADLANEVIEDAKEDFEAIKSAIDEKVDSHNFTTADPQDDNPFNRSLAENLDENS